MTLAEEITRILAEEPADHRTLYSYLERNPSTVRKELSRLKAQGKIVRHSDFWQLQDIQHPPTSGLKGWYWPIVALAAVIGAYYLGLWL